MGRRRSHLPRHSRSHQPHRLRKYVTSPEKVATTSSGSTPAASTSRVPSSARPSTPPTPGIRKQRSASRTLHDVPSRLPEHSRELVVVASAWFTGGWKLQELLAPCALVFVKADWTEALSQDSLIHTVIPRASGIDAQDLAEGLYQVEDEAYLLMGRFSMNMLLLYGEGGRRSYGCGGAFSRTRTMRVCLRGGRRGMWKGGRACWLRARVILGTRRTLCHICLTWIAFRTR